MLKSSVKITVLLLVTASAIPSTAADPPDSKKQLAVCDKAQDFALQNIEDKTVSLAATLKRGPVVLVVLRGYPGYQCPFCTKQFGELFSKAKKFDEQGATLVFVYPGPAPTLDKFAKEFVAGRELPKNFQFLTDPDYKFTQQYGLRWSAPNETAYPSSFVIDSKGVIRFAKISHTHDDRATSAELLDALAKPAK